MNPIKNEKKTEEKNNLQRVVTASTTQLSEPPLEFSLEGLAANHAFLEERYAVNDPSYKYKGNCTKAYAEALADKFLDREFSKIQNITFPKLIEREYTDQRCRNEIETLITKNKSIKTLSPTIRHFHKSIVNAGHSGTLSPYDGWQKLKSDKALFRKFYLNRVRCSDWFNEKQGKNREWLVRGEVPEFIYGIGLTTSASFPLVSYFKPHLAKYLVRKYLAEFASIFDPFSGYSGRMMGVLALGKNYIGCDLNEVALDESQQIYDFMKSSLIKHGLSPICDLKKTNAETNIYEGEALLTCSPYGSTEKYPIGDTPEHSCDDWIDICLRQYKCRRYVFVTDGNISKWKKNIVEELVNTCHWGKNSEYVVVVEA